MKKKAGFTLVEIMIVVAIIGLLAAIAIPSFVTARNTARQNACINNLRLIDAAKEQAALAEDWNEGHGIANDSDDAQIVLGYIRGGTNENWLTESCPSDGKYEINNIGQPPTCSVADHEL